MPEGGVYAFARQNKDYEALIEQSAALEELFRPVVINTNDATNDNSWALALEKTGVVLFDGIVGRNALTQLEHKSQAIAQLKRRLAPKGKIVLAESIPSRGQRLSNLLNKSRTDDNLLRQLVAAETLLYNNPQDPMLNWDAVDLQQAFELAGFACNIEVVAFDSEMLILPALLQRWLGKGSKYRDRLIHQGASHAEVNEIQQLFHQQLTQKTVVWTRSIAFVEATLQCR